ncbi:hypothetical protein RFI_13118 [Reticulomyxa filosa]|uniref:Uncharacterized protein n=1 Tax=Reticulomyxa filosa TaxID=46433 RepID=X6NDG8_RETFI|nr:hypothetical protein RFI_13118 [Reticulomyxa filosa]|eukprot:ETO24041.1 hypothetical protein RFI_13118 [Reticulomyxa filosa]
MSELVHFSKDFVAYSSSTCILSRKTNEKRKRVSLRKASLYKFENQNQRRKRFRYCKEKGIKIRYKTFFRKRSSTPSFTLNKHNKLEICIFLKIKKNHGNNIFSELRKKYLSNMQSEIKITIPSKNWGANVLAGNKKQRFYFLTWIKLHAWNEQEVKKLVTFVEANSIKGCELLEMSSGDIEKDLECTKGIAEELHRLINIYNKNVENWTPLELSSVVEFLNIVVDADLRKSVATYIVRNGVIASEFKKWSGDDLKKKMGIEKGVLWLVRLSKYIAALSTNKTSTNDKERDARSENESEREKQREKDRKKEEDKKRSQKG